MVSVSEQTNATSQNTVSNQVNDSTFIGESISIGNITQIFGKSNFFEPKLDYTTITYIKPSKIRSVVDVVLHNRLLVIGGNNGFDKSEIIRYMAWYIKEMNKDSNLLNIREWNKTNDTNYINSTIRSTEESTIFILPDLQPQDIRYNLEHLAKSTMNKHYIIASSEQSEYKWKIIEESKKYWADVSISDIFFDDDLIDFFIRKINDVSSLYLNTVGIVKDSNLTESYTTESIVQTLQTPESILSFLYQIEKIDRILSDKDIENLIQLAKSQKKTLDHWFHLNLNSREQMFVLGLSMFDNLFDDQFFRCFEKIVSEVWHLRDETLRAIDYDDLNSMSDFFNIIKKDSYTAKIESRYVDQRLNLLEIAWNSHRRQIINALPILVTLIRESVNNRAQDPELYANQIRRDKLRLVISDTISDIGIISPNTVELPLLALAADNDINIQSSAARAIARWRTYNKDQEVYDLLAEWQTSTRFIHFIESLLSTKQGQSSNSLAYIRATIALTIAYATQYDSPNTLNSKLVSLINELSQDKNPLVRDRFIRGLPFIINLHLKQLTLLIENMINDTSLIEPVAISLAVTYLNDPNLILQTLAKWANYCLSHRPLNLDLHITTHREKLCATILYTYGYLPYFDEDHKQIDQEGYITHHEGFQRIKLILKEETHPFIRLAAIESISLLARSNFKNVANDIQQLTSEIPSNLQNDIVFILRDIYLDQRRTLNGEKSSSDNVLVHNNISYPLWVNSTRPRTELEEIMGSWLQDSHYPKAQEIAIKVMVECADALDNAEVAAINQIRESQKQSTLSTVQPSRSQSIGPIDIDKSATIMNKLASWLATIGNQNYNIIKSILPESINQYRKNRDRLSFAFDSYGFYDQSIKLIKGSLWKAIFIFEKRGIIAIIIIIVFLLIFSQLNS